VADLNQYLSIAENEALINPGLRQTAKTLDVFLGLAAIANMPQVNVEAGIDAIRALDKLAAKRVRQQLARATNLLNTLIPIDVSESVAVTDVQPVVIEVPFPGLEVVVAPTVELTIEHDPSPVAQPVIGQEMHDIIDSAPVHEASTDVATEPVVNEEPTGSESEASAEVVQGAVIAPRGVKFLTAIVGDQTFVETLVVDNIPAILESLSMLKGKPLSDSGRTILELMLKGHASSEIATLVGVTEKAVTMSMYETKRQIITSETYTELGSMRTLLKELLINDDAVTESKTESVTTPVHVPEPVVVPKVIPRPPTVAVRYAEPQELKKPVFERLTLAEGYSRLREAVDRPSMVSTREWEAAASDYITTAYARLGTDAEAQALWNRIHITEDDTYKAEPSDDLKMAIKKLVPEFAVKSQRFNDKPCEQICLRTLLNTSMGYKTLDNIQTQLMTLSGKIRQGLTQRYTVAAIAELLHDAA
jgi:hypothetical protein